MLNKLIRLAYQDQYFSFWPIFTPSPTKTNCTQTVQRGFFGHLNAGKIRTSAGGAGEGGGFQRVFDFVHNRWF